MGNSFNRTALGTYGDISDKSGKYNYYEKFDNSTQSNILEKLGQIQKKDLFFILSVNSFGLFVIIYFLLYLFS
jgi:hypothetical protein